MVFDIKMEDFRQPARLVEGGHMTKALSTVIYSNIVSQETVRVGLMTAVLNDLEVKLGDILNAYVQPPVTEMWITLDPEVGKDARKTAVMIRAFYGFKSAVAAFASHLARFIESLGYQSCKTDQDS